MNAQETLIPCLRFGTDELGDPVETSTLIGLESSNGEGMVDIHVAPRMDEVFTFSVTVEDGWRLVRELSRSLVEAERE